MSPEQGVAFNADPMPPREYLMRRSYNPNDASIPGAVIREVQCLKMDPPHPTRVVSVPEPWEGRCVCGARAVVYSVDVPLVKTDGERWS